MMSDWLATTDVARALGVSSERVRQLERAGVLPAIKTPGGVRIFSASAVEALRLQRERERRTR